MKPYYSKIAHQAEQHWVDFPSFWEFSPKLPISPTPESHKISPAASVKTLIETFRRETKASKQFTDLYDSNPDSGDKDVVKELTKLLDPDTVLPAGYKRVAEQDVIIGFGCKPGTI